MAKKTVDHNETKTLIIHYLSKGMTNAEIASIMARKEKYIKNQLTDIFKKEGVKNRQQLIVKILTKKH